MMVVHRRSSNRDSFTANERLAILAEYEAAAPGQKQVVCRRYDVNQTSVLRWRKDQRAGLLEPSEGKHRGHVMNKRERADYVRALRENETLKAKLAQSESAVEVLGKASELLASMAKSSRIRIPETPDQTEIPVAFRTTKPQDGLGK
ncbi:transposase-like protein [Arthrobacter pigmenti]|uniref:Transposase-like protein n=1 Tax=Arthrobacter pigmenti TaxID=271432 RepID=A0A846RQ56_9MICC|nr:transposase-like protein [Arthrobacter pigmenti]